MDIGSVLESELGYSFYAQQVTKELTSMVLAVKTACVTEGMFSARTE